MQDKRFYVLTLLQHIEALLQDRSATAVAVGDNAAGFHLHFNNLFFTEQTTAPDTMTGLDVVGTETVDARMNWWGDATGPGFGQSMIFDSCIGQAYSAGQGSAMLGYGCFMPHLFKEFLGLIEPKDLSSSPVSISALGSLEATASADGAVKMVFSSFDSEPIAFSATADLPIALLGARQYESIIAMPIASTQPLNAARL